LVRRRRGIRGCKGNPQPASESCGRKWESFHVRSLTIEQRDEYRIR
jgi:hypothetical protein